MIVKFRLCKGRHTKKIFGFQIMIHKYTFQFVRAAIGVFDNEKHNWIVEAKFLNRLFK